MILFLVIANVLIHCSVESIYNTWKTVVVIVLKENIVGVDIVKEDATEMTNVQRENIAMH